MDPTTSGYPGTKLIQGGGVSLERTQYEATAAVTTHESEFDPHSGYQKEIEKGLANGYPSLGSDGRVPQTQLPVGSNTLYAPDSITVATGNFQIHVKRLTLTGSQRVTLQGTARMKIL